MTTSKRNPEDQSLLIIIGQLMEAVKTATEGLRSVSQEGRQNTQSIITTAQTVESLQQSIVHLEQLVRTGDANPNESLLFRTHSHRNDIEQLQKAVAELRAVTNALTTKVAAFEQDHHTVIGFGSAVWYVCIGVFQLVTLGVAVYAAVRGSP